jgi:hypothetical protein
LERELLRLYVEAEGYRHSRLAFEKLVGEDRVVLDMLWALCLVDGGELAPPGGG